MADSRQISTAPAQLVESGGEVLSALAEAFADRTIEIRFASDAVEVSGSQYLQFATIRQNEVFERTDSTTVLWGALPLPDVVVEARAPVTYTYLLDLEGAWRFDMHEGVVFVSAPTIEYSEPAVDASRIEYRVRQDSLLRDSDEALEELKSGLTRLARHRAEDNVDLVRDTGRQRVEDFVRTWLLRDHEDAAQLRIEVRFADEDQRLRLAPQEPGS